MSGPRRDPSERETAKGVVDFSRTARRLRRMLIVAGGAVLVSWPVVGAIRDTGLDPRLLGELAGWAVLAAIAAEFVIVGGSAISGMLRAGDRGDRLASDDVALIPPQLRRRRRRDGSE